MALTESSQKRENFFTRAQTLSPGTLGAIQRIIDLQLEESRVDVEFTNNEVDHSMLVRLSSVPKMAALFKVESTGRLMLMTALHRSRPHIQNALGALAEQLAHSPQPGWESKKPTFLAGKWEDRVELILQTVKAIARTQ